MARKPVRKAKGSRRKSGTRKRAQGRGRAASARRAQGRRKGATARSQAKGRRKPARKSTRTASRTRSTKKATTARGGTGVARRSREAAKEGREETLSQTPQAGRSVSGPTNPRPTKRSTGTAAGAGTTRHAPSLERARKQLREVEENVPGPPSSLNLDRHGSAARTGRATLRHAKQEHTETSPALTGGDVDADWEDAYAVGDEAPGGDNPTPDQDRVDDIGRALGVEYQDNEELKGADKIAQRDRRRWELDPASSDDYTDRD
jgi:hypothetical protein